MHFFKLLAKNHFIVAVGMCAFFSASLASAQQSAGASRHPVPPNAEIRAIYLTGASAGLPRGKQLAMRWRQLGGNAVVFDLKDNTGPVSFNAPLPLAGHVRHPYIPNLAAWAGWLHAHGLYVIGRMTVFQDERLVREHPELAVHSRASGGVWVEHGNRYWVDPSQPVAQNYNIALAKVAAESGVDEIQFDAIRFPVEGNQKDAVFAYQAHHPNEPRANFISNFLYRAQQALKPTGVRISIDVYGVMGWTQSVDLKATGQDVASLAYYCNVICPMIYPSHFFNHFDGLADPSAHPEHFIQEGMRRFENLTRGEGVTIRPWLQAFAWRTKTFSPAYVQEQIATERAGGGGGFMLWNAGNHYSESLAAMPAMVSAGGKYFAGGFPYVVTAPPVAGAAAPAARSKSLRRP